MGCCINPFQTNGIFPKASYKKVKMVNFIYIKGSKVIISKSNVHISFSEDHFWNYGTRLRVSGQLNVSKEQI